MEYNREMDAQSNPTVAFLSEYKEGVCRHYAQAATLLYRSLGIPARYTVGFYVHSDKAGMVTVTNKEAHAWVEVYIEDLGWVYVEVTGESKDNTVIIQVSPNSNSDLYDSNIYNEENQLTSRSISIKVENESWSTFEQQGYTVDYILSGGIYTPGKTKAKIETFTIYDASFNKVYDYSNGEVTFTDGTFEVLRDVNESGDIDEYDKPANDADRFGTAVLHLYRAKIRFSSDSFYKTYGDGDEWKNDSGKDINQCSYSVIEGELGSGVDILLAPKYLNFNTPLKNQANEYNYTVVGASSDEYLFDTENHSWGTLTVHQRVLTFYVGSATSVVNDDESAQVYDEWADYGEGNKVPTWWENLAYEDEVTAFIIDTQGIVQYPSDHAPTVLREGTIQIKNAAGDDVTSWYVINAIPGTFRVVAG